MKPQTFSITMTLTTDPTGKPVSEDRIKRILKAALDPDKVDDVVDKITFEVVDMTDSLAYKEQLEADRLKAVSSDTH
jgi:hypothetical protein